MRYETQPPRSTEGGAAYQSWLRRHIAKLEALQAQRIALHAQQKKDMDAAEERAAREIANLKSQQTIGSVK